MKWQRWIKFVFVPFKLQICQIILCHENSILATQGWINNDNMNQIFVSKIQIQNKDIKTQGWIDNDSTPFYWTFLPFLMQIKSLNIFILTFFLFENVVNVNVNIIVWVDSSIRKSHGYLFDSNQGIILLWESWNVLS